MMSLRRKTILVASAAFFILLTVLYFTSARVFLHSYDSLEEKFIYRETEKIKKTFDDELNALSRTSKALSHILSSAPKNIPLNSYLNSSDLDLIATFDRSGEFLSGKMNGPDQGADNQLAEEATGRLSQEISRMVQPEDGKPAAGAISLVNRPMLISVYPIPGVQINSFKPGFVVVGRSINNSITQKFVQSSGLRLSSQFLEGNSISDEYRTALITIDENRTIAIQKVDDNKIAGYFLLEDINGNPSLFLRIQSPRYLHIQGLASAQYLVGFALVIGLILLALTLWLFEYLVISRLAYLRSSLGLIAENTNLSGRLPVSGNDEFSQIAMLINGVLNALEESTREKLYRLTQFRSAAEISRTIITEFDTDNILQLAVDAIRARFQLPYVGVYLQENNCHFSSLQAISSDADIQPTTKGEEIDIQGNSTIGQCIRNQKPVRSKACWESTRLHESLEELNIHTELALPLVSGNRSIGALQLCSEEEDTFDSDEDITILQSIADTLATALENAKLFHQTQSDLLEIASLHRLYLAQAWKKLSDASGICVQNYVNRSKDSTTKAFPSQKFPISLRGHQIGAITIRSERSELTQQEQSFIQSIANQTALAMENARLFAESRRWAGQLQISAEIARETSSTLSLDDLLNRSVHLIRDRFEFYYVAVFLFDPIDQSIIIQDTTSNDSEIQIPRKTEIFTHTHPVVEYVLASGKPLAISKNEQGTIQIDCSRFPDTLTEVGIPLIFRNQVLGVLDIHTKSENHFSEDDVNVLQILADQIAVAVNNARLYQEQIETSDRLRELDHLKSQFLANMSHELRTPLNAIIGFSRIILQGIDGPITDIQREDLGAIHASGQNLLNMINNILDSSKIEAGKMELIFENVNITELIESVLVTARGLIHGKPIQMERRISTDLPTVRADSLRLRQVLTNLISNAAKFTENGTITVSADVQTTPDFEPEIVICVTDTGCGITPFEQQNLFEPFSQAISSGRQNNSGTGLGLSISKALVEMHGGRIGVTSALGYGSTFYFTLPVVMESDHIETRSKLMNVIKT
jgi:signal transduction histidine kinase/sensor domain CHASE-containing protein